MPKINYRLFNGTVVELDVTEEVKNTITSIELKERNEQRYVRRRKTLSIDSLAEYGFEICDASQDILFWIEENEKHEKLNDAISRLSVKQKELLYMVYYEDILPIEIARQQGKSPSSICRQLKTIHKNLKNFLK